MPNRIHEASDWLIISLFPEPHWWLHFVVNVVLVVTPLAFVGLAVTWAVGALRNRAQRRTRAAARDLISPFPPSLFSYILKHTRKGQATLLVAAVASMPVLYAVLELPKQIINRALIEDAQTVVLLGQVLSTYNLLLLLCALYLVAVVVSGAIKYFINVFKGRLSEAMLRRMRFAAFRAWSRGKTPCDHAQVIPLLVQEVEPVAGFTGDSLLTPVFQGGSFLTILLFMVVQNPVLGIAALTLMPLQIALVPRLQRRVSALGRARVKELRSFGTLVAEADPRSRRGRARSATRTARSLKTIQRLRYDIYRRKFFIKGLNNFISHLTPFFFYTIGGYLVIEGRLSLGALIAVLAAYKDLSAPLRELFAYYQTLADVRVRYDDIRHFLANQTGADDLGGQTTAGSQPVPAAAVIIRGPVPETVVSHMHHRPALLDASDDRGVEPSDLGRRA